MSESPFPYLIVAGIAATVLAYLLRRPLASPPPPPRPRVRVVQNSEGTTVNMPGVTINVSGAPKDSVVIMVQQVDEVDDPNP